MSQIAMKIRKNDTNNDVSQIKPRPKSDKDITISFADIISSIFAFTSQTAMKIRKSDTNNDVSQIKPRPKSDKVELIEWVVDRMERQEQTIAQLEGYINMRLKILDSKLKERNDYS